MSDASTNASDKEVISVIREGLRRLVNSSIKDWESGKYCMMDDIKMKHEYLARWKKIGQRGSELISTIKVK